MITHHYSKQARDKGLKIIDRGLANDAFLNICTSITEFSINCLK